MGGTRANQLLNKIVVTRGGADAADSNTQGVNITGAHCFECWFTGDVQSWAIKGGGTAIYNSAA